MSLRLGSRRALIWNGSALTTLIVAAACSSGSSNVVTPGDDGGGTSSGTTSSGGSSGTTSSGGSSGTTSSGGSSGTTSSGGSSGTSSSSSGGTVPDGGCPVEHVAVVGAHITFAVDWAAGASGASNGGTGNVDIWLKSTQTSVDDAGTMFTGVVQTCGTSLPDLTLTMIGTDTVCPPGSASNCATTNGKINIQLGPNSSGQFGLWDAITKTFMTTGTQTSWNPGGMLAEAPVLGALGLASGSYTNLNSPAAWPPYCANNCTPNGSFMASDLSDDDNDGHPGITAIPLTTSGYTAPPTQVALAAVPPLADKVYIVSRNTIAISGMRMNDCNHGTGTATISLFDNHVVGCHATAGTITGTGMVPAAECTSGMVSFLDQNRTVYTPHNSTSPASATNKITGKANVVQLSSTATCADVRAIPAAP